MLNIITNTSTREAEHGQNLTGVKVIKREAQIPVAMTIDIYVDSHSFMITGYGFPQLDSQALNTIQHNKRMCVVIYMPMSCVIQFPLMLYNTCIFIFLVFSYE